MDLKSIYETHNDKLQADGLDPISPEQFIEDLSVDMCQWLIDCRPELILEGQQ